MNLEKWLAFEGNEIANAARTLAYINNGLAPNWMAHPDCACDAYDEGPYETPALDDAPWYDSTKPDSGEFLGILLNDVRLNDPWTRKVTPIGVGGGVLGPLTGRTRILEVTGTMVASSSCGMRFGEVWLGEVLRGSACQPDCGAGDLCVLPCCPDTPAEYDAAFKTLVLAGLVEGPTFSSMGDMFAECYIQQVKFIMTSGSPYLFSDTPTLCLDEELLDDVDPVCCTTTTGTWPGNSTLVINVYSGTDVLTNVRVTVTPILPGGACPPSASFSQPTPCVDFTLVDQPRGTEAIVDGRTITARVLHRSSQQYVAGLDVIQAPAGELLSFPNLGACSTFCICAEVLDGGSIAADATITVSVYERQT